MHPYRLFGNEREIVDAAFPAIVVGIPNHSILRIGDTLCVGEPAQFAAMAHTLVRRVEGSQKTFDNLPRGLKRYWLAIGRIVQL